MPSPSVIGSATKSRKLTLIPSSAHTAIIASEPAAPDEQADHDDQPARRDPGHERAVALDRLHDVGEDHARARGGHGLAVGQIELADEAGEPDQILAVPLVEAVRGRDRDDEADP